MRRNAAARAAATRAFTASGNNFERAIAVAAGVGPLVEVPALIALGSVALAWKRRLAVPA